MTERTPPIWLQSGSYPAEDDRRLVATVFGDSEGIVTSTDLAVTQRGAGANMSVDVAGGRCVVKGDLSTYEGSYFMENRGTTNLAISASDPTNPRIDRVIAEVLNAEYSGVSNLWRLRVVTGTPAAVPAAPALPDNSISLATVAVAALASSITNASITDTRTRAWTLAGIITCTSTTRPSAPFEGMEIYETDTDRKYIYSGSAWVIPYPLGRLATTTRTTASAVFTTAPIIYPNSLTFTALPNRRLRIRVHANVASTVAGTNLSIGIANGAGSILNQAYTTLAVANAGQQITTEYETTSGAGGSLTFQISAFTAANSATITASGTAMTYITAFDEGPV